MKLASCIHLEELVNPTFNFESRRTFYASLTFGDFMRVGHFLRHYKG